MMQELRSNLIRLSPDQRLFNLTRPVIGLTGGIAAGKSTVLSFFSSYAPTISADDLIQQIYAWPTTIDFLKTLIPDALTGNPPPNHLNKNYLRQLFFTKHPLAAKLEEVLYGQLPTAIQKSLHQLELQASAKGDPLLTHTPLIFEVPLLFEKHWEAKFDQIIGVYASPALQEARLRKRELTPAERRSFIQNQLDGRTKMQHCAWTIENDGDFAGLEKACQNLAAQLFI